MKKLPIIIGLPAIAIALIVGGALVWKLKMQTVDTMIPKTLPNALNADGSTKPSNPFSALFGPRVTPIPTPTPASAAALNTDLQATADDGGASDFNALKKDASGL